MYSESRAKVPSEIRRNSLFLNSELDDIKLSDQAQKLFDNSQLNFEMNQVKMGGKYHCQINADQRRNYGGKKG